MRHRHFDNLVNKQSTDINRNTTLCLYPGCRLWWQRFTACIRVGNILSRELLLLCSTCVAITVSFFAHYRVYCYLILHCLNYVSTVSLQVGPMLYSYRTSSIRCYCKKLTCLVYVVGSRRLSLLDRNCHKALTSLISLQMLYCYCGIRSLSVYRCVGPKYIIICFCHILRFALSPLIYSWHLYTGWAKKRTVFRSLWLPYMLT